MAKKLCIAVGAVIVGLIVIFTVPRIKTLAEKGYDKVAAWATDVPVEDQLKQAKAELVKVDKDIRGHVDKLAAREIEVERLEGSLTALKADETKQKAEIASMMELLNSKEKLVSYKGRKYQSSDLALKLDSAVNTLEITSTEIKTKEQVLKQKRQSLELAHQRITEMRNQKEKLRVEIAEVERELEALKLQQVDRIVEVDDSQVNKCNVKVSALKQRIAEEKKKLELYDKYNVLPQKETSNSAVDTVTPEEAVRRAAKALNRDEDKVAVEKK